MSDNANMSYSENQNTAKLKELVKLPENEQYLFLLKDELRALQQHQFYEAPKC